MSSYQRQTALIVASLVIGLSCARPALRGTSAIDCDAPSSECEEERGFRILLDELYGQLGRARRFAAAMAILDRPDPIATGQIMIEADLLDHLRQRAIADLEVFIESNPNDPDFTPDALLRLAELSYEQSTIRHLEAVERWRERAAREAAGENLTLPPEPVQSYPRTIELTRQIIEQYPSYPQLDAALYLLGLCLNETGFDEEAQRAWLHLVCSNHFQYQGPLATRPPVVTTSQTSPQPFVDPYAGCTPVTSSSPFLTETWFRIGESHFDYGNSTDSLELAIVSYQRAANDRSCPFRDIILYKLAWAFFRSDRYDEALEQFTTVVALADETYGRSISHVLVRPEAVQYLAICFAEDDWDNDARPDAVRGIDRLQDPDLFPQDRVFTAEVYFETGDIYFDLARYSDAIEVYELALRRWPLAVEAPVAVEQISLAQERNRAYEEASTTRIRLIEYGPGSEWQRVHSLTNPDEARAALRRVRAALYDEAIHRHTVAQRMRRAGVENGQEDQIRRSRAEYELAVQLYIDYLERYPHDRDLYELTFNLAEAHFFAGQYREAAVAFTEVRDSLVDDRFRLSAAFRAIKSLEQLSHEEETAGRLNIRENAPAPRGVPPRVVPVPLPELLRDQVDARDVYVDLSQGDDVRSAVFRLQNALVFFRHGHWPEARTRFTDIYSDHCRDHPAGQTAWQYLISIATGLGDRAELERLNADQRERQCAPVDGDEGGIDVP